MASGARGDLRAALAETLSAFCGDDPGRSVSFRGYAPAIETIAVRGDVPRPAASVMKVPLLMAVYRDAAQGRIDLGRSVLVESLSRTRYVSILAAFDPGRTLSLRELARLAVITSDNPAMVRLQSLIDFAGVNGLLAELGCPAQCRMAAGFSEDELGPKNRANVLTTDACIRIWTALKHDPIYADLMIALKNNLRNQRIPALLPDEVAAFHKTGSLDGVVNDVGILEDDRVCFALAFLTDGQSDPLKTTNDIAACSLAVYERVARGSGHSCGPG
jgi:beta-lactamase class A